MSEKVKSKFHTLPCKSRFQCIIGGFGGCISIKNVKNLFSDNVKKINNFAVAVFPSD